MLRITSPCISAFELQSSCVEYHLLLIWNLEAFQSHSLRAYSTSNHRRTIISLTSWTYWKCEEKSSISFDFSFENGFCHEFPIFSIIFYHEFHRFFYSFNFFSCIRKKNPTFYTHENDGFIWTYASWFFFLYWLSTILAIVKIFPFRIDWKVDMSFRFSGLRRTSLFEYFQNEREIISFDYSKILPSFFSEWIH